MQPALSNKSTHLSPKQGTVAPNRLANKTSKNSVDSFFYHYSDIRKYCLYLNIREPRVAALVAAPIRKECHLYRCRSYNACETRNRSWLSNNCMLQVVQAEKNYMVLFICLVKNINDRYRSRIMYNESQKSHRWQRTCSYWIEVSWVQVKSWCNPALRYEH